MKIVIIGGVGGGATAAARLRRLDESAEIIIFERTGYISYANCGLPYYVGDVIEDKSELTLSTPESFFKRYRIKAFVSHEVTAIKKGEKCVEVTNLLTGKSFSESYDKLILSPGAKPALPSFFIEDEGVFTLRTVEDSIRIREFIESKKPRTATVIGGGFIGIEMAENLCERGISVSFVQKDSHLLPTVDFDMAAFIHAKLRSRGVNLLLNKDTEKIFRKEGSLSVKTSDEEEILSDMVIVCTGVVPETSLAKEAGIELGIKGAIKVNSKMQTSEPDIYAVGDAVYVKHFVTGEDALISLAGPANKEGRIAADNICGLASEYRGSQGSSVIKIFDMTVGMTGISEKAAKLRGYNCEKIIITQNSHASYYPGAFAMTMKLVFDRDTGKILGACIVGYDGVDKRIDVIATAIRAGFSAEGLSELDLAYAPPYSSAKDPVNMLGFVAENIRRGIIRQFYFEDIEKIRSECDSVLLDTRTTAEYERGHAEGFINIPLDTLRERLSEIDRGKKVYVMCQSGLRSYLATRILMQNGYDAYNFAGGYRLFAAVKNEELLSGKCYGCGMDK